MDLDEVTDLHQGPGPVAVGLEGRHEGGEHHHAGIEEQLRHLADATDVLLAVCIREAQVGAEAVADVVAIQHVAGEALLEQGGIDGIGQGALARSRQPREPEDGAAVAALVGAGPTADGGVVPDDVGGCALVGDRAVGRAGGAGGHGDAALVRGPLSSSG